MRIIAGEFRGRKLDAPRGDGTRPTTDRVRESLMSALVSLRDGLDGAVVLDAFAGSGALSLEALSLPPPLRRHHPRSFGAFVHGMTGVFHSFSIMVEWKNLA